jgi:prepilin-type N-terminal cleavage/methylation domain-containing protein
MLKKSKGFTLFEVLIVIVIIGILTTIIVVVANDARKKGRDAKREAEASTIGKALRAYEAEKGYFPNVFPNAGDWCTASTFWTSCPWSNYNPYIKACVTSNETKPWPNDFKIALQDYLKTFPVDPLSSNTYQYIYSYDPVDTVINNSNDIVRLYYCKETKTGGSNCALNNCSPTANYEEIKLKN